jgi:hypothetical protein
MEKLKHLLICLVRLVLVVAAPHFAFSLATADPLPKTREEKNAEKGADRNPHIGNQCLRRGASQP